MMGYVSIMEVGMVENLSIEHNRIIKNTVNVHGC